MNLTPRRITSTASAEDHVRQAAPPASPPAPRTCRTVRASPGVARRRRGRSVQRRAASGFAVSFSPSRSRSWGSSPSSLGEPGVRGDGLLGRSDRRRHQRGNADRSVQDPAEGPRRRPAGHDDQPRRRAPTARPSPTKIAGTAGAPITIKGPETGRAVERPLQGRAVRARRGASFSINHSYYTLERLHDRRPAEHRAHRVPRRHARCRRSGRSRTRCRTAPSTAS